MTSSTRLCTVELIHRRRCESSTENFSGATVVAEASERKRVRYEGKCLSSSVVR